MFKLKPNHFVVVKNCCSTNIRMIQTTSVALKTRAGRIKTSKSGDKAMFYEKSFLPEDIMKYKALLSHHTGNLHDEKDVFQLLYEDQFVRRFIHGTFYRLLGGDDIVIKRRFNIIEISMFATENARAGRIEFLKSYSERLLSAILKCIVKIDVSVATKEDLIYKYI